MLVFIDESGFPRSSDPNLFATLAAVALPAVKERSFCRELFNLKKKFWNLPNPYSMEIKGRKLLSRGALTSPKKKNFVIEVLELCKSYDMVFFATIKKRPLEEIFSRKENESRQHERLSLMFQYLLERINTFIRDNFPNECGVVFFDSQNEKENRKTALRITDFLYKSWGRSFENIVPTPFFADSKVTAGIQIADLAAYCINQYFMERKEVAPYYDKIREMQFRGIDTDKDGNQIKIKGIKFIKDKQLTIKGLNPEDLIAQEEVEEIDWD